MLQDLRFALRLFRKHSAPVGISVGGLALAIGVVTSVFSLVNASMLRPYGMDDPSSVMTVALPNHGGWSHWAYSRFLQMREGSTLSTLEASLPERVRFSTAASTDRARDRPILFVSGGYLPTLGGRTSRGRALGPSDDRPGAPAAIVVSDHFWQTELTGDPAVVGKTVWLNDSPVSIVGVMQAEFTGPVKLRPSIWATFAVAKDVLGGLPFDATTRTPVEVIARLAPGATLQAAQDNLTAAVGRASAPGSTAAAAPPGTAAPQLFSVASPIDRPDDPESVFVIASTFGAVGLVLALACANTANLLMAAAVTRRREIGVRLALGAAPRRLLRQMISESLLLGGLAAGLGFALAMWLAPVLRALVQMSPEIDTAPDGRVVLFTVAVALVCGAGCGLAPARHGVRGSVVSALQFRSGARVAGMPSRSRTWFVGFQVAVSMLLLVVAALLARTAVAKARGDVGFDADRLLAVSVDVPRTQFDERMYLRAALDAVRTVPTVERASITQYLPLGGMAEHSRFAYGDRSYRLQVNRTDADYLATMGVRVLRGRAFTDEEVVREAPIALISASAARALFGDADAVGQSLSHVSTEGGSDAPMVIGVVTDTLTDRLRPDSSGAIYRPISLQRSNPGLIVRTANPGLAAGAVEEALRRIDPRVQPETWRVREKLDAFQSSTQMLVWLTGPIAVLAFLLAGLGVYGVTSFVVSQRRDEVSVRLAIGASAGDVLRLLVKDGLRPVISGLVVGLAAALVVGRLLASSVGISPYDPLAIGIATTTLLVGAFIAVIVPARRAAQTDPASVLR
jgi:predicted permease